MERNGEDYVCPNCNTHKVQITKTSGSTAAADNGKRPASGPRKAEPSLATSSTAPVATEEKAADDLGIKGRIEKAANPSGKKKIKIFQPVCCNMDHESKLLLNFWLLLIYQVDKLYIGLYLLVFIRLFIPCSSSNVFFFYIKIN